MRTMTDRRWPGIALGAAAAMLLASCSGEKTPPAKAAPEATPAPVAVAPPATLPAAPMRPEGADAIDAALGGAQAFNAKALTDLAAIERAEKRIRDLAGRALEAARRGDAGRVTAARNDAEAAHRGLADSLAAFRTAAAEQQAAVTAALALCGPSAPAPGATAGPVTPPPPPVKTPLPGAPATGPAGPAVVDPTAYQGCAALAAEQTLLAQNIEAVGARYQAAEASYRQDRPRLEEAAATVALGKLGSL
jgi:hypothetical protein